MKVLVLAVVMIMSSCGIQYRFSKASDYETDSSFIYALPYPKGSSHLLLQGYKSLLSHRNRMSLDFKMKSGAVITAARSGVVVRVVEEFSKGGVSKQYVGKANQVVIRHIDGSNAYYGHLKQNGSLVQVGDTVVTGQPIAIVGTTGFSALPHLHFIVWGPTPTGRSQLPTRFKTKRGVEYLKPGRWYRAL